MRCLFGNPCARVIAPLLAYGMGDAGTGMAPDVVARHRRRRAVDDPARDGRPGVPDARPATVQVDRPLDLRRGRDRAEPEARGEPPGERSDGHGHDLMVTGTI